MKPLPHSYAVTATAREQSPVELSSEGLSPLLTEAPADFGGPGGHWSPETLAVAAVADCLVLGFRAIAAASRLKWTNLVCNAEGIVDRVDGAMRFTGIRLRARLVLPAGEDPAKGRRIVEKAEKTCLVANSLKFEPELEVDVAVE